MKRPVLSSLLTLALALPALAGPAEDFLMARPTKPTAREFLAAYGGQLPSSDPYANPAVQNNRLNNLGWAPLIIAQLEFIYPGARFVFLGRDATHIADMFQAFYEAQGQVDRVIRVEGSSATINSATDDQLAEWLNQLGARPRNADDRVVLLDATAWADNDQRLSQVRRLLRVIYQKFLPELDFGPPSAVTTEKMARAKLSVANAVAFERLDSFGRPMGPVRSVPNQLTDLKATPSWLLNPLGWLKGSAEPTSIYAVNGTLAYNGALYALRPTNFEWHDSYQALEKNENGQWAARIPDRTATVIRQGVLSYMYSSIKFATGDMYENVTSFARERFGYNFSDVQETRRILVNRMLDPGSQDIETYLRSVVSVHLLAADLPAVQQFDVAQHLLRAVLKLAAKGESAPQENAFEKTVRALLWLKSLNPKLASLTSLDVVLRRALNDRLDRVTMQRKITPKEFLSRGMDDAYWDSLKSLSAHKTVAHWLTERLLQEGGDIHDLDRLHSLSSGEVLLALNDVRSDVALMRKVIAQTEVSSWDEFRDLKRLVDASRIEPDLREALADKMYSSAARLEPNVDHWNTLLAKAQDGPPLKRKIYAAAFQNLRTGSQYSKLAKPAPAEQTAAYQEMDLRFRQSRNLWFSREEYEQKVGPLPVRCELVFQGATP